MARLSIYQAFVPERPHGDEGSISFVVLQHHGEHVLRRQVVRAPVDRPQTFVDGLLEPGSYRILSYQRACGPSSCDAPGPSTPKCQGTFDLVEAEPIDAVSLVRPNGTCDIRTGFYDAGLNAVPFR